MQEEAGNQEVNNIHQSDINDNNSFDYFELPPEKPKLMKLFKYARLGNVDDFDAEINID